MTTTPPGYDDVAAAAKRIAGHAHQTPVVTSRLINEQLGLEVFLKCENLQRVGAFKFRGAFNALSQFTPAQRKAGVVAYSSGNHAQAIALSAQLLNIPATILMPLDAPAAKMAATRGYGAEVITFDRYTEDREQLGEALAEERGLTLIPSYDHADIIAGQGTAAMELFEEVGQLDALFVPLGGGGLLSGCVLTASALAPSCRVVGVEPEAGDDALRSLREGRIVHIDTPKTIADGAQTQHLGALTFEIMRREAPTVTTVADSELVTSMRLLATYTKMLVEPTGCLGFAGLRAMADEMPAARVGVILSGGNIDLDRFARLVLDTGPAAG